MPLDQFKVSFADMNANMNTDKMQMDYYLKLDDKAGKKSKKVHPDQVRRCGSNCITHDLHVVSTKDQRVWISLNTWR